MRPTELVASPEVLEENRFLAARDGMDARLIDPSQRRRVPVRLQLVELLKACAPHARALGCADELGSIEELMLKRTGAERQTELARGEARLPGLVAALADDFVARPEGETRPSDLGHLARGGSHIRS